MDRVKSMYQLPSLDAKICLNIMSIKAYDGSFTTTAVDLGKMYLVQLPSHTVILPY